MNRWFYLLVLLVMVFGAPDALAQDTLPKFSVRNMGNNRIVIGWINNYPVTKQISIQRSFDSLKNFKTILSVTDPSAIQNGFADTKAPNDHMFYRLFVNLDKGEFFFTGSKKPDTSKITFTTTPSAGQKQKEIANETSRQTNKKPEFVPSFYVFTNRDGYVFINLPDAERNKYRIRFYEEDDSFLFELKNIREAVTLDKANFIHSGWFKFELYNDDKLLEKNKFYLSKEF